ncbi:DUF2786 domain-containing protein [Streptomyces bacillaris]|uniref:DUF2786 domain-containing protein n=1 Tax=Streptomyces bacillaris TaxID=68179 RepID=UPI0034604E0C
MTDVDNAKLKKIRALLDMAEGEGLSPEAAENYRLKAYELMAKYGIEQALLDAAKPGSDKPADRIINLDNPWSMEKVRLMNGLAQAMGCELIHLGRSEAGGRKVHVFGHESDLQRMDILFTSLLLQMFRELARTPVPPYDTPRAFRRSWIMGFADKVSVRVGEAERRARNEAAEMTADGRSTALVLADRKALVRRAFEDAYPRRRNGGRTTMRGRGYGAGAAAGARADIGGARVGSSARGAIAR